MIFEKHRFEIWSQTQHPFRHSLTDFSYSHPAFPGVTNVEDVLNWIAAVIYPTAKPGVATTAALPALGNTLGDYRVVLDDGDGKAASYRWEQREGEVAPSWHKVMDMDWSTDSILAAFLNVTQDLYVVQDGKSDLDSAGAVVVGLYAGQKVYGGNVAGQNLTLAANSGDGVGPSTGYVQVDDNFRPTADATWSLGTLSERFLDGFFSNSVAIDTLTASSGSITDSTGAIDFDNENLSTTGAITGNIGYFVNSVEVGPLAGNALILAPGSITDESGAIDFGNENLSTTGTITGNIGYFVNSVEVGPLAGNALILAAGSITDESGLIDFNDENLQTTGTLDVGAITATSLDIDDLNLNNNTISITTLNTDLALLANGTGVVDVQSDMTTLGIDATGTVTVTGQLNADNLRIDGNTLSSTDLNGNIIIDPNGTGVIEVASTVQPTLDGVDDLGTLALRFNDLFLAGDISDGTNLIAMSTLLAFRSGIWRDLAQTVPAQTGDALFFDAVNQVWLASVPDTEVDHGSISGLLDDDHTQYALLAGRATGQSLIGGTAAGDDLTFESTSNGTKGNVFTKDTFAPFATATYAAGWSGVDLGDSTHYFRHIYTKGEFFGFRWENLTFATLPGASAQNIGRVVYTTDEKRAYLDTGTAFKAITINKHVSDTVWDGIITSLDTDVSADIVDARRAQWQLRDNANNFEIMGVVIKATSASNVRIEVNVALPAGSYRLIGVE